MDNPFLALFENTKQAVSVNQPSVPEKISPSKKTDLSVGATSRLQRINQVIENSFLFTINPYGLLGRDVNDPVRSLVFLQSIAEEVELDEKGRTWLDLDVIGRAIFERVLMSPNDLKEGSIFKEGDSRKSASHFVETKVIVYLSDCFLRIRNEEEKEVKCSDKILKREDFAALKKEVIQNAATAFCEPDLYQGQHLQKQFFQILSSDSSRMPEFINDLVNQLVVEDKKGIAENLLHSNFNEVIKELRQAPPMTLGGHHVRQILLNVARAASAAEIFILFNFPKVLSGDGRIFGQTLLGVMLTKSCLPEHELGTYDFFDRPSKDPASVHSNTERSIWMRLDALRNDIFDVFNALLRSSPRVKHLTLMWLGDCLLANAGRGKLWTSEMGSMLSNSYASDGFFLNLGDILLRLCNPFCTGPKNSKILKVDPRYVGETCQVSEDAFLKNVHLRESAKETCLLPRGETDDNMSTRPECYNFISDIFFLAHKALDLGFRVCHEKFMKLNQELGRQQQIYRSLQMSGGGDTEATEAVQNRMEILMQRYLSLKSVLLVPAQLENMMHFSAASSTWMIQIALQAGECLSQESLQLKFPLDKNIISPLLKFVPEFVMENVIEHILLAKRFCPQHLEEQGEYLSQIFELILVFMGSRNWVKNPHLRAKLAECLEALLPISDNQGLMVVSASVLSREQLFLGHPVRLEIVSTLLNVFVDIEMTGQAVAFEMKFSYRRPMYEIIKYLWEIEEYKKKFLSLAEYAEDHINDEDPPLFLRFVNLLINDAIFLLDEALNYMKQLQQFQEQQPTWTSLPQDERANNENQYQHTGRLARYHNIMGLETIQVLDKLTSEIRFVFLHPTMVDRIAAMLNYFLKHLVGPERKNFKVKNIEEYSFRPADIVTDISRIYINYKDCQNFTAAVSQDGRSYSPGLFSQAEAVLIRIGRAELVPSLQEVASTVNKSAETLKAEEEMFADAPDHFLDPIMSILMKDPVKLPTSGQVVDRSTIARHLLSDQSDPFNRCPLTMDMVIPQTELQNEIDNWIQEKRKKS